MTVTASSLKARWPEFAATADATVTAAIAEAARSTDARVYGDAYDDAVALLACHLLATSAYGMQARLDAEDASGMTTFLAQRERMARAYAGGPWVPGYHQLRTTIRT